MNKPEKSLEASFFENLFAENQDPWNFEESEYEKAKYAATMRLIPNDIYASCFEIGCANGMLTMMLQQRCQKLLAVDASRIAVGNATKRAEKCAHVSVREMEIPKHFPDDRFDLILLSEVGYFLNKGDLTVARDKMIDALLPDGHLILVHWTPFVEEFPLTGDEVHELFLERAGEDSSRPLIHLSNGIEPQYRMDLFSKRSE